MLLSLQEVVLARADPPSRQFLLDVIGEVDFGGNITHVSDMLTMKTVMARVLDDSGKIFPLPAFSSDGDVQAVRALILRKRIWLLVILTSAAAVDV